MSLTDRKFKYNQSILKVYGYGENKKIKVIQLKILRTSGIEEDSSFISNHGKVNDFKLDNNIIRAKNKIFELAFCNPWQYFFTGTIDSKKYDRTDLDKYHKDLTKWLCNQGQKFNTKIDYLLIPELHTDGKSWHIHGFINGLPSAELTQFQLGDKMGKAIADKVQAGEVVYNWSAYANKFGFCDLELIQNHEAVSKYITKYINKGLANSVTVLNAHLFYHSRGLNLAQVIKKGTMFADIVPTYSNDYCKIAWLDYSEETLYNLQKSFNIREYLTTVL